MLTTQAGTNVQCLMEESEARFKMQEQQVEECEQTCDDMSEAEIDEMLAESFPSNDPPSWTLGIDKHCELSKKRIEAKPMKGRGSEPPPEFEFGVDCQHSDAAVCYPSLGSLMSILGATGLKVSPIGLGLAALGRPDYINLGHAKDLRDHSVDAMESHAYEMLDAAWESGVRYFDVARSYGLAECFLGAWLKRRAIEPQSVTVGSKWGYYYAANWHIDAEKHEIKDHSLPLLRRQWQESSGFLGAQLDLYQIHSATTESRVLENREVLLELFRLSQSGIKIGLTLSGPGQSETLHKALSVRFEGVPLFQCVQATWNLLNPSACGALAEAKAAGWGVIIKEALANGRLTMRNTEPSFIVKGEKLERQAKRLNTTIDVLAISGALAQPWADVVLSGAVTTDQLRSNLKALKLVWDEEAAAELSIISEPAEQYWAERSKLAWN